jgi:hypothetical protein
VFEPLDQQVRDVVAAQSRRFFAQLVLGDARRLLRRAARKSLRAELDEAGLYEVAQAVAALEHAVATALAALASDVQEN